MQVCRIPDAFAFSTHYWKQGMYLNQCNLLCFRYLPQKFNVLCPPHGHHSCQCYSNMQTCHSPAFSTLNICLICSLICVNNITSCIPLQRGHSALSRDIFLFPIYKVVLPLYKIFISVYFLCGHPVYPS